MMRTFTFIVLAASAACSGYDPDLGPTPFLCGDGDPECPDGYACESIGSQDICIAGDIAGPDGSTTIDGPPGACTLDSGFEPNESYMTAFTTDAFANPIEYGPLQICTPTDKDHFRIIFPSGSVKALRVTVTWDSGTAPLASILGTNGMPLMTLTSNGSNSLFACSPNLPAGNYYALVSAAAKTTYNLALSVTADCGM